MANMAELNGLIVNRMQCGIVVVDNRAKIHLINLIERRGRCWVTRRPINR
jgi:hypothetical protein